MPLPDSLDLHHQLNNGCLQRCSPERVALVESKQVWSPQRLRPYCEKLADPGVASVCSVDAKEVWSPNRLRHYCEKLAESKNV